jgi:hypothetical protein
MRAKSLLNPKDKQESLQRLQRLQADSRPLWGQMSAHQMICHLADSFRAATGEKGASPATNFINRTVVKWIALQAPMRWPKGVKTRPEMDQLIGGTKPIEFETDRKILLELIERFTASKRDFLWGTHPLFGEMTELEWLRWGYLHLDHHLRQFGL